MGREKKDVGALGEKAACRYLKRSGYRILEKNFRTPFGEIDIVARYKGIIVFIEVKTRTSSSLGPPCLSVTMAKQRHIIKNSLFYLNIRHLMEKAWRIDIVSVNLAYAPGAEKIELIENAVEDPYV